MKNGCTVLATLISGALLMGSSQLAQAADTGCMLTNGKTISITNLDTNPTYTYGKTNKVEMTLPGASGNSAVYKSEGMFSGGGFIYVRFTNGTYSYVAYNGAAQGWDFEGLLVYKGQKLILHKECKDGGKLLAGISVNDVNAPEDSTGDFIGPPD